MSGLDWPALRGLIDAGEVGTVARLVSRLEDRQRRILATPVKAYARALWSDPEGPWGGRSRSAAALRVAGVGCLSGADTVARWLTRQDLRTWDARQSAVVLLGVLRAREVPWLPELAHRLAARLRSGWWEEDLWWLVAELVKSTGIEPPTADGFVLGWMQVPRRHGPLADALAVDPFLAALAPQLFEVEGVGRRFAWSASSGRPPQASWPLALAALTTDGRLGRAALLDGCVGRLLRGGRPGELRGYLLLHEALDPDLEEVADRARDYARLLADGPSAVAVAAQRALRRLDDAGRLEFGLLLEVSRAALVRSEKKLVGAQLSWLDAAARRRPDRAGEVLGVVGVAFAQEAAELQTRAVSLVVRYARHADQAARAGLGQAAAGLPADLRQRAAVALGGRVPEDEPASWPVLLPPTPQELPPPIATPAELAEELAAFWEGYPMVEPLALERLLAALVGFAATDRSALGEALEPVLIRHRIQPRLLDDTHPGLLAYVTNEAQQLIWAILAAITPAAEGRRLRGLLNVISGAGQRRWHGALAASPRPRLAMVYRLHEIAAGLHQPAGPSLVVAAPTAVTGHIDPAELAARLERAAAGGWEPWPYDLEQALLRLPRQPDASAAARARRLDTPAGRRLADWLAGGGLPDPEVTRVVRQIARRDHWPPYLIPPVARASARALATVTPGAAPDGPWTATAPPEPARRLLPRRPPLAALLCELAEPERWEGWQAWDLDGWLLCWPALLPSHRDVIAAHLQPRLANLPFGERGDGQVLPLLAQADGPMGPGMTIALAYGLGARDRLDRAAAVDALVILAGHRQLDAPALGAELAAMAALDLLRLGRVIPPLRDLVRSGGAAEVWAILAAAIPRMLPPAMDQPPRGLPDLIALAAEVAGTSGRPIPELAAITERSGSSRLRTQARRLQHLLP